MGKLRDLESVIDSLKTKGFTYYGEVNVEAIFCNAENEESIKGAKNFLCGLTGERWDYIKTDKIPLMFYRSEYYELINSFSKGLMHITYRGNTNGVVQLPLGCKCIDEMFDANFFDSKVEFSEELQHVTNAQFTFQSVTFGQSADVVLRFDSLKSALGLFTNTTFKSGCKVIIRMPNIIDIYSIFNSCTFEEGSFVDIEIDVDINGSSLFRGCKFAGERTVDSFSCNDEIVYFLSHQNEYVLGGQENKLEGETETDCFELNAF